MNLTTKYVSVQDLATMFNVSVRTMYRHVHDGAIHSIMIGGMHRILSTEVERIQREGLPSRRGHGTRRQM